MIAGRHRRRTRSAASLWPEKMNKSDWLLQIVSAAKSRHAARQRLVR